jgi:hypothetical protein
MSQPAETLYNVALKHLTRDGKKAAANLPAEQLSHISARQLRGLLEAIAGLGPDIAYPIEPEVRIDAPEGKFVVQVKGGKLQFVSWSSQHKAGEYSAERIFAIVTGQDFVETASSGPTAGGGGGPDWLHGKAMMIALIVAIIGVNAFTLWFVTRPKRTLVPKYTLLAPEPAERLLANIAGFYETGGSPGDRRLEIDKSGKVHRYKFAAERTLTDPQLFNVQGADAQGKPALLLLTSSKRTLITVADPLTVVLYGDKYKRVQQ